MARSPRKSLAGSATAMARRVLGRASAPAEAEEAPAVKTPAKKTTAKKTTAKKASPAKKTTANKAAAKKASPAKKSAPAKKSPAKKAAPAKKTASAKKATPTKKAASAKKATPTKKAPVKKTTAAKAPAVTRRATAARAAALPVREGEDAWTKDDLAEVLDDLHDHRDRITAILTEHEVELADLMRDFGDGAGQDQADVGTSSFERDQEITVLNNEREMLVQIDAALVRIGDGTYGVCASCGNPIGKGRLMAFPRAGLCLTCKQREERR